MSFEGDRAQKWRVSTGTGLERMCFPREVVGIDGELLGSNGVPLERLCFGLGVVGVYWDWLCFEGKLIVSRGRGLEMASF